VSTAEESNRFETRWPAEGDRLFIETTWANDARLVIDPSERFHRLAIGYSRAGDLLADQASNDVVDRRNVVFAALFCYRQAVELSLKKLIAKFGDGRDQSPKNTHDLLSLWERFICIVNERGEGQFIGLVAAQTLVTEMHEADQKSDTFRFPAATDGTPFSFANTRIDLKNLREVMAGLINLFECVDAEFDNQTSFVV